MFATFKNAWKIKELRNKILFTLLILFVYRLGTQIPVPFTDVEYINAYKDSILTAGVFGYLNTFSGQAFSQATLFALSVSPYITASIIIQLLTVAIPPLERMSKDGEAGKKKINMITRLTTVVLALVTAIGYMFTLKASNFLVNTHWFAQVVVVASYCAGAAIIMWLAERINEHGIGNGVSMILFANIVSSLPSTLGDAWDMIFPATGFNWVGIIPAILLIVFMIAVVFFVVWFSESERRIPIQYAKRVVGRKMYGGQSSNLPIKINMSGVMPIIFASSIVSVPATIVQICNLDATNGFRKFVENFLGTDTWLYMLITLALIVLFAYFYIMISFNPVEVANNIQKNGGSIPGIRSGRPTVQYIKKILNRITLIGAFFLCVVSGLPMLINVIASMLGSSTFASFAFSGNSMLIVVGVVLETSRDLEAQVSLRSYGNAKTKGIFG